MKTPDIFINRHFKNLLIAMGVIAFAYVIVNAFLIGGNEFIFALNQNFYTPFALGTAILAVRLWSITENGRNKILFAGLSIGWICWFVAELTWGIYTILGREVPYPSLADVFWVFGYIPIIGGLYLRLREIPVKPTSNQRLLLWAISIVIILITFFFILLPILKSYDPVNLVESILNVTYPLVDLLLLVVVLQLLFVYQKGNYGVAWLILSVGFMLMSVSDLIFAYASSMDLYYPESQVNLISSFGIDIPYGFSYLIWIIGLYALIILLDQPLTVDVESELKPVPNSHIIIHTKNDDTIIKTSGNFEEFFGVFNAKGISLREALGLSEQDDGRLNQSIRKNIRVSNLPVAVKDRAGKIHSVFLVGLAIMESEDVYQGANLCLRLVSGNRSLDHLLSDESRSVLKFLLDTTGINEDNEVKKLLFDYHLIQLQALHNFVVQISGSIAGDAYWEAIQSVAAENEFKFKGRVLDMQASLPLVRKTLPLLLDTAVRFAGQYGEPREVEEQLQNVRASLSVDLQENIAYHTKLA